MMSTLQPDTKTYADVKREEEQYARDADLGAFFRERFGTSDPAEVVEKLAEQITPGIVALLRSHGVEVAE